MRTLVKTTEALKKSFNLGSELQEPKKGQKGRPEKIKESEIFTLPLYTIHIHIYIHVSIYTYVYTHMNTYTPI